MQVCVDYDDASVAELIWASLSRYISNIIKSSPSQASLQWSSYESIHFDTILANPKKLCNSYIFRKALIRKHFLATTVENWLAKHPESILFSSVPKTYLLDCDYADYLDEALNECYELRDALEESLQEKKYFILKPSMTDRGQGIRLFSTRDELETIFDQFDDAESDEDDENGIIASQLRHFVVQEYVSNPLLLNSVPPRRKFHVRAYVVAFGAIKVWVWSEMLALFASKEYVSPSGQDEMEAHLTNTCLQDDLDKGENVLRFWDIGLDGSILEHIFEQICKVTGEIFLAAAAGQQMHFQVSIIFNFLTT
jgi:tubulin---tyrosine ligase